MKYFEDPTRQIGYLMQCVASDKRPLGLFLGAGCPMSVKSPEDEALPLIPDIAGLTKMVRAKLIASPSSKSLLNKIDDHFKNDCKDSANVERILSHIRGLKSVAGNDVVRGLKANELDQLDDEICAVIFEVVDKGLSGSLTPYHQVAAWVDGVSRDKPVEIFTTNYDLLMEQAFEDRRVPYFDGFAGSRKPFFDLRAMEEDMLPSRWARLWKLHGSINWYHIEKSGVFRGTTAQEHSKRVIHPSHLKYEESRRMPYLAMLDRLRAFLKQPSAALIVSGFSFGDEHLNEILIQGLQNTQTAIVFALLYGDLEKYPEACTLARSQSNLTLLAKNGAIISGSDITWASKDSEASPSEELFWIGWKDLPAPNGSPKTPELKLGDFAIFARLLFEMLGNSIKNVEMKNAN